MRCQGTNRAGNQCGRQAMRGGELCHAHRGKGVGRPSKLTDEVVKQICVALRAGNYMAAAAAYAGISRSTVYRLLAAGDKEGAEPKVRAFLEQVRKAEADAEVHAIGIVRQAIGRGDWRAAIAFLERRHPERWRPRQPPAAEPQPTSEPGGELDATDPDTRELLNELLRRQQTGR